MEDYLVKVHDSYRYVVAICDKELYGKKLEEENVEMDLSNDFFNGKLIGKNDLIELIKVYNQEDATFNIVGEKSVNLALELGIISLEGVKKINNIPYAFVLL